MPSVHGYSVSTPPLDATTDVALPSACLMRTTGVSMTTLVPAASTLSRHTSHIIPGPYFGYWNSSISEVICFFLPRLPLGLSAVTNALQTVRSLMRCAAKSAEISDAGRPHSFSLYDLN